MKGFKTVAFGVALALTAVFSSPEMQAFVAAHLPAVGGSIGLIVIILRAITASPIFSKPE